MEEKQHVYEGSRMLNSIKVHEYISHTEKMFVVREQWGKISKRPAKTNNHLLSFDKEKVREFVLDGIMEELQKTEQRLIHLRREIIRVENL